MYFLIDTNIFIYLVNDPAQSRLLAELESLCRKGKIRLLVPETLLKEWNNKKEKTLTALDKELKAIRLSSISGFKAMAEQEQISAQRRAEQIDEFIQRYGIAIPLSNKVKAVTIDRSEEGLAPFHSDSSNNNRDCQIFFSAVFFLRKHKVTRLIFVSNNSADFSDPSAKDRLHPDLAQEDINIEFDLSLGKCLNRLKEELNIEWGKADSKQRHVIEVVSPKPSLLDHLHETLTEIKKEIRFIPTFILSRINPLRIPSATGAASYYSNFTLVTNNRELLDFFKNVRLDPTPKFIDTGIYRNSKNNLAKLNFIIRTLNANLVFNVSHAEYSESINIRMSQEAKCDCITCRLSRLEWHHLKSSFDENADMTTTLKQAATAFEIGEYDLALKFYYKLYLDAVKNSEYLIAYIAATNLKWAVHFAEYRVESSLQEIIHAVQKLDVDDLFFEFAGRSKFQKEVAREISRGDIFRYYIADVKDKVDEIEKHYHSQLKGGVMNNNNYNNLISAFAEFNYFTGRNGMAYTHYSDYKQACSRYVEGLFMTLGMNEYQPRLTGFDDFCLLEILIHGQADDIIRYYNSYIRNQIPYLSTGKTTDFKKVLISHLSCYHQFSSGTANFEDDPAKSERYFQIFWNGVALLAIVEFDPNFLREVAGLLKDIFFKLPRFQRHEVKHFGSFLEAKGDQLDKTYLEDILRFIIDSKEYHDEYDLVAPLSKCTQLHATITDETLAQSIIEFAGPCSKCNSVHHQAVFLYRKLLAPIFQMKLADALTERLRNEFNHHLYYYAAIYDVIDYKEFFGQYVAINARPEGYNKMSFHRTEILHQGLSNVMNLVFKYNETLPDSLTAELKQLSPYYEWLLDLENFDYNLFNPLWILQYTTVHYLKKLFSVKEVKQAVKSYLDKHHHPKLAHYYVEYA